MVQPEPILFKQYPSLREKIPWIPLLINTPTPIERLNNLEDYLNLDKGQIFIKRDDKNHPIYGGNKLRKFEFIFGKILRYNYKGVLTTGGIGTNHGLACTIVCNKLSAFKMPSLSISSTINMARSTLVIIIRFFWSKTSSREG